MGIIIDIGERSKCHNAPLRRLHDDPRVCDAGADECGAFPQGECILICDVCHVECNTYTLYESDEEREALIQAITQSRGEV